MTKSTVRIWRGNRLPHPNRHSSVYPPLGRDLGRVAWIAACELCGWAVAQLTEPEVMATRREHLLRAHGPELAAGRATVNLCEPRRPSAGERRVTSDEIVELIDAMKDAWPWAEWTQPQLDLWCGALADLDIGDARGVAVKAVKTLERPPTIAWFRSEAHNRYESRTFTRRALPPPEPTRERRSELVALVREALAVPRDHDHHQGWEGCPTCSAAVARDRLTPPPTPPPSKKREKASSRGR